MDWIIWLINVPAYVLALYGVYRLVIDQFLKPRLRLVLRENPLYVNRRDPKSGADYGWVLVDVVNNSKPRRTLKNCSAFISKVSKLGKDGVVTSKNVIDAKIPLKRSNTDETIFDIAERETLDLLRWQSQYVVMLFAPEGRIDKVLSNDDSYVITIEAIADNASSGSLELLFQGEGTRKKPKIVQVGQDPRDPAIKNDAGNKE